MKMMAIKIPEFSPENSTEKTGVVMRQSKVKERKEKKKEINRYITFSSVDHVFLNIYNSEFRKTLKKDHPMITEEQLLYINHHMELLQEWEITAEEFREQVRDHFETLAKKNNGSILAFIPSFVRRFEIPYTGFDVW